MTIRLSGLAKADIEDIRDYTVETWGRDQWLIYYLQLVTAFERITEDPGDRDRRYGEHEQRRHHGRGPPAERRPPDGRREVGAVRLHGPSMTARSRPTHARRGSVTRRRVGHPPR